VIADRAPARASGMSGLLLGAAGMFATMYASHAILPELPADFAVTPSQAGLSISVVVLAVALCGWLWGPFSDRVGRKRSLMLARSRRRRRPALAIGACALLWAPRPRGRRGLRTLRPTARPRA
jgi:MFS family permease